MDPVKDIRLSLLDVIAKYDNARERYIDELQAEVADLKRRLNEAIGISMKQADASDRMKLDLIMSGALRKPDVPL